MNSVFNDSVSESKIEQALAECAALTRVNDPRRALNIGRMIESAHPGQPRVLARVARMYSELGLADESARVLRGLHSAVRPSASAPRRPADEIGELPSFADDEPTLAKSVDELTRGLPGVPTLMSSVPPPPQRSRGPAAQRSSAPPAGSQLPPPPMRSSGPASRRSSAAPLGSQLPPPQRSGAPPAGSQLPPLQRSSAAPLGSQ